MNHIEGKYIPVTESGCWLWLKHTHNGDGRIRVNGKLFTASRLSYIKHIGEIPDGLFVLHKCDVRCCVNPDHLYVGTHQQNMTDRMIRERTHNQRFMRSDKKEIATRYFEGEKQMDLAVEYNTTQGHISKLIKAHLTGKAVE